MKISARNVLSGTVKSIKRGEIQADVQIEVAADVVVESTVSVASVDDLGFSVGDTVYAVFDSSAVLVGIPHHKRGE